MPAPYAAPRSPDPPPAPCRRATPARPQEDPPPRASGAGAESSSRAPSVSAPPSPSPAPESRHGGRRRWRARHRAPSAKAASASAVGQERRLQIFRVGNQPHAPSAPARGRLEEKGKPTSSARARTSSRPAAPFEPDERQPGVRGRLLCANLVAHDLDRLRPGAHEDEVVVLARRRKICPLREGTPSRGARLRTQLSRPRPRGGNAEVAFGGRRRSELDGSIRQPDVQRVPVGESKRRPPRSRARGRHGRDARRLAAVRDQDAAKHRPRANLVTVRDDLDTLRAPHARISG